MNFFWNSDAFFHFYWNSSEFLLHFCFTVCLHFWEILMNFLWIPFAFLLNFLWNSYAAFKTFIRFEQKCMKFWQKCMKLLKLHKNWHKKCLKNTKGTHKISQEVHKKFKRDFMKVWCTRTIYCDPQKKDYTWDHKANIKIHQNLYSR